MNPLDIYKDTVKGDTCGPSSLGSRNLRNPKLVKLGIAIHGKKMHKIHHFGYALFGKCTQKPLADNQNDLGMHFLIMSHNDQATMHCCNGQVFFKWKKANPSVGPLFVEGIGQRVLLCLE